MNRRTNLNANLRQAFSLIEVLLAVFILALGLLGLGAMVPVVIREQREAADATLGLVVANSAETYLKNRPDLNRWTDAQVGIQNEPIGWGAWYSRKGQWSSDFSWECSNKQEKDKTGPDKDDEGKGGFNVDTGRLRLQIEKNATSTPCFIRVQDRLWPDAAAGGTQPRFVWDIVGRRLRESAGQPWQIQIAVFVRRIDPNIRVPVGATLYQVLTQFEVDAGRRVPVGVSKGGNNDKTPQKRRPTLDGTGEYAKPFRVDVFYDSSYPTRIRIDDDPPTPLTWQLLSRPGQKVVDNLGNVYTVISQNPALANNPQAERWVEVDPPVASYVSTTEDPGAEPDDKAPANVWVEYYRRCDTLRHLMMTPQIPAAVTVFTVQVEDLYQNPGGSGAGDVSP